MSLQSIPLAALSEVDLRQLIADGTRESRFIEYKRDWRLVSPDDRREFLADVSSFANAGGGDLIYGIAATDGVPTELRGLDAFNVESEQLKVEQLLASWIDPRLPGLDFRTLALASSKPVFLMRVPRSWSGPHMVTFNGSSRFFSRNSAGKYQLDVNELRTAFGASATAYQRIRDFRLERINRIAAGEAETPLLSRYGVVVHLIPVSPPATYEPAAFLKLGWEKFHPLGTVHSVGHQINFESCMFKATLSGGEASSYAQVFRNGAIEAILTSPRTQEAKQISPGYEEVIRAGVQRYFTSFPLFGASPPIALGLTHVNAKEFTFWEQDPFRSSTPMRAIDRSHLIVPEVLVEMTDALSIDRALKQAFDQVWNACGRLGSPHFQPDGAWQGSR